MMKKEILSLIAILLLLSSNVYSNHILGGTLSYQFLSSSGKSSTYKATLELYSTCFPTDFPNIGGLADIPDMTDMKPELELYKSGVRVGRPVMAFDPSQSKDVTALCPSSMEQSSCNNRTGYLFLGALKYVYTAEVVLDGPNADWQFVFNGFLDRRGPRTEVFYQIDNADVSREAPNPNVHFPFDIMYLVATLDNTDGPNNSVIYTSDPIPIFCEGHLSYYGLGAADKDHDKLKFKMVPGRRKQGTYQKPVVIDIKYFDPPYSGLHPLPTAPDNFNMNASNGQMIFTPDEAKTCMVVIQTDEYRNGKVVGSTVRQMTFFIQSGCDAEAPVTAIRNIRNIDHATDLEGNLFLSACEGLSDTAGIDITVSDPNTDNVTVSYDNLPEAALVSVDGNGTQNPVVHFNWDLVDAEPATYLFYLTYTDDGCPITTKRNVAYSFTVVPHNIQFESTASGSCAEVADGKASVKPIGNVDIDYNYKWFDTTGNLLRNINSNNGDNIENLPPGNYKVRIRNQEGCGKNIYITIDTTFPPKVLLPNDSTVCEGMPILLSTRNENGVNYKWSNGQSTCCIYAKQTGNYTLTASNHCGTVSESVTLEFVKCNYCFFVPNAFSPNGDGQNDLFEIIPTCLFQSFKIQIFNREGRLMFVSYSLSDKWNGTYKGKELAQATYYYVIEAVYQDASKGKLKLTGDVTLLR
jgi:gliding motility-associated-like protein